MMCLQDPGGGTLQNSHDHGLQLHQTQCFQRTEPGFHSQADETHTADSEQLDRCSSAKHPQGPVKTDHSYAFSDAIARVWFLCVCQQKPYVVF